MRNLSVTLAVMAGSVLFCSPVFGDVSFSFSTDQWSYSASPGDSVNVSVYLQEAVTFPDWSLLAYEDGLLTAGVLVERVASSLGDPAVITDASANVTEFDDIIGPMIELADNQASIFEMRDISQLSGVLADETFPGSGVRRILLGTLTLSAGPTVGEVTTFNVGIIGSGFDATMTSFGSVLDDSISSTSFTVATVPLPSAVLLGLIGFGAGGLGLRREWARRV